MKANNGKGNNPLRDDWETPQELFDTLNKQYHFTFDCCATQENRKAPIFASNFEESLFVKGIWWMNPPFSKAWKMFEHFFKTVKKGVAIYRFDNAETGLWQRVIFPNASWIFIPNKRINYEGMVGKGSRFPSALIGFNVDKIKGLEGITLTI